MITYQAYLPSYVTTSKQIISYICTKCNIDIAKQYIICHRQHHLRQRCNFILCPMKINDVDRKRSNDVLATLVMMLCSSGHKHKKERPFYQNSRSFLVPVVGVEPTRCCHHEILSLARLPIPSHRHFIRYLAIIAYSKNHCKIFFLIF